MRKLVIFIVCLISQRSVLAQTLLAILMLFTTTMSFAQDLTINSAEDWNAFASDVNSGSDTYSGKIVKLAANISGITMMVGTSNYPFRGTFDGGNNTLDVNISDVNNRCTAPFRYISGATIKNLKVTGTVTGYWHCAGLVGSTYSDINTITDCTVSTSVQGDYYKGGVVGHGETCTLNITNTVFNGTIAAVSYYTGGLQGWSDGNTLNISNCLFNGVVTGSGPFHPVAISYQKTTASVSQCYYTVAPTLTDVPNIGVEGIIAADGIQVYAYHGNLPNGAELVTAADGNTYYFFSGSSSSNETSFTIDGIGYKVNGTGTVKVSTVDMSLTSVSIPSSVTYNGKTYSVTAIGDYAFKGFSSITSVTLPSSLTHVGEEAFYNCSGLKSITIPNNVITIAHKAFMGCTSLASVTFSNSVTTIGRDVFNGCKSLTYITIPNSVTYIGESTFAGCSGLVTVESQIISPFSIETNTFGDNTYKNAELKVPQGTKSAYQSKTGWKNFKNIVEASGDSGSSEEASFTSGGIGYKYNGTGTVKVVSADKSLTSVSIPSSVTYNGKTYSVTAIGDYAFKGFSSITSVTLPSSLTHVGEEAFYNCSGLKSITIPNNVITIAHKAFMGCSGLTSVTLSNNLTAIGRDVFNGCWSLPSITIPSSVTYIGVYTFYDCTSLKTIESQIYSPFSIEINTFGEDTYKNAELIVPKGTKSAYQSKTGWSSFSKITESSNTVIETKRTIHIATAGTLKNYISEYEKYQIEELTLTGEINGDDLGFIREMAGKKRYGERYTLGDTEGRLVSIDISGTKIVAGGTTISIDGIDDWYEYGVLRDNELPSRLFEGCKNLASISIPNSVSSVGTYAFDGTAWYEHQSNGVVYIGKVLYKYKGDMPKNTSVTIKEGTIGIACSAFSNCANLVSITIPNTLTNIGGISKYPYYTGFGSAFYGCTGLTSITIPNSVTSIGDFSFSGCTGLTAITIPSSVTSYGQQIFSGCTGLATVTIANGVTSIGDDLFYDCTSLNSIVVEEGNSVFDSREGCNAIIRTSDNELIVGCMNTTIPNSVTKIGRNAFYGCTGLTSITIPNSVKSIEEYAFSYCNNLTSIISEINNPFEISDYVFYAATNIYSTATLLVPYGAKRAYQSTGGWKNFTYIIEKSTETDKAEFTVDGIHYFGSNYDKKVWVKDVDKSMLGVVIPESVSYNGTNYKVGGLENYNLFEGSNMRALVWDVEGELLDITFANMALGANFLLYVKSASYAPSSIKNVVVNGIASSITISDNGGGFYCPRAFTAEKISYTHYYSMETGGNGKGWETIALPYDVLTIRHTTRGDIVPFAAYSKNSGKKPFWLCKFGSNGFIRANYIQANRPYIIAMPNQASYNSDYILTGEVTFSSENVTVATTPTFSGTFVPTFSTVPQSSNVYALNVVNSYVSKTGGYDAGSRFISYLRDVRPFEAYISEGSTRGIIEIGFEDGTTGMGDVLSLLNPDREIDIYTLNGQKVKRVKQSDLDDVMNQLPHGVYIVNGQKIVR